MYPVLGTRLLQLFGKYISNQTETKNNGNLKATVGLNIMVTAQQQLEKYMGS